MREPPPACCGVHDLKKMQKIRIKNFGPVSDGYSEGFFDINKCTVIIGEQGSGKSTIAKIYSTFAWLEKDFERNARLDLNFDASAFRLLCKNQGIEDYFSNETELEYIGDICSFKFSNNRFSADMHSGTYITPKIMYIPSERNLLTVVDNADKIQKLPIMLRLLQKEYSNALSASNGKIVSLPLKEFSLKFDLPTQTTHVLFEDKSLKIQNASSGLQSLVPISIVVNYLQSEISKNLSDYMADFSNFDFERIKAKIVSEYQNDKALADHLIQILEQNYAYGNIATVNSLDKVLIEEILKNYVNMCLLTIVEEPEQNLFPVSQVRVLEELIRINNAKQGSTLFITTHSPYILSALNNYIYAEEIYAKKNTLVKEIDETLLLNINDVSAYKVEDGKIIDIKNIDYNLIDTTQIDDCSSMINTVYDKLVTLDE